jgi:hypothetical protein
VQGLGSKIKDVPACVTAAVGVQLVLMRWAQARAAEEPGVTAELGATLRSMMRSRPGAPPPPQLTPELIRSLRALGYVN